MQQPVLDVESAVSVIWMASGSQDGIIPCRVVRKEDTRIWVQAQSGGAQEALPKVGCEVRMFLETEDANWSGTGRLAELKPHFDHPLFGIEITEEWQKLPDRSAKRVRCDLPVMCHFRLGGPKGQTKRVLGRLMDISTTGCQVRLRTSIPVGIAVILQLSPPGNEGDIVLSGNVMRQAQSQGRITPDYGIRFLRFEDKAKSAIEEWLRTGLRPADGGETQAEQTA